jgi:hypothetical protein
MEKERKMEVDEKKGEMEDGREVDEEGEEDGREVAEREEWMRDAGRRREDG